MILGYFYKQKTEKEMLNILWTQGSVLIRFCLEHCGHCTNMVKDFNYGDYDAVVICSGDGLVFEVNNNFVLNKVS